MSWMPEHRWRLIIKRILDLVAGSLIFAICLPLVFLISLLIKLDSRGPVLFVQKRLGKKGKIFNCLKFRTMTVDAEQVLDTLLEAKPALKEEWEANFKIRNDPRVTRVGKYLRKTSLDEVPQIINVILGQMSLVGPRPRPLYELEGRNNDAEFQAGLLVRPGMTGYWQVSGRNKLDFKKRISMDEMYVKNWSLGLDFKLLLRTLYVVIWQKGSY